MNPLDALQAHLLQADPLQAEDFLKEAQAMATHCQRPAHIYRKSARCVVVTTEDPGRVTPKFTVQPQPRKKS